MYFIHVCLILPNPRTETPHPFTLHNVNASAIVSPKRLFSHTDRGGELQLPRVSDAMECLKCSNLLNMEAQRTLQWMVVWLDGWIDGWTDGHMYE